MFSFQIYGLGKKAAADSTQAWGIERDRDRDTERERDRDTDTERDRARETERRQERETDRQTDRQTDRETVETVSLVSTGLEKGLCPAPLHPVCLR